MVEKEKIYYPRTYRKMQFDIKESLIFGGIIVLPVLILYLCYMENLIKGIVKLAYWVLSQVIEKEYIQIQRTEYSAFWTIEYLELPTTYPAFHEQCVNLLVCLALWVLMKCFRKKGSPMAIFSLYCIYVHGANCIYFLCTSGTFPYTIGDYSELYLKQQIGIWLMFIIMAGLVFGCLGRSLLRYKIVTFLGICIYSLVFGAARYIFFLFLLFRFSVIYMAVLFFVIGPMVDFVYFVMIYAAFMNKMTKEYAKSDKKGEWKWS